MDYSQATHDEVNLLRLVQRLEKAISSDEHEGNETGEKVWLRALGTLQVKKTFRLFVIDPKHR